MIFHSFYQQHWQQGRREGVKGLTVSRGPVLKRGPEITKSKEKLNIKKISHLGPQISGFQGPKPAYLTYTEVNSHVWRGLLHIGFTGPGQALDAPEYCIVLSSVIDNNRPIAKIFFIFFLESTFKNKLKFKILEFLAHSLILNSNLKLQRKLFKRVKTFENKRKEAF